MKKAIILAKMGYFISLLIFAITANADSLFSNDLLLPVDSKREVKGLNCQSPSAENICSVATRACAAAHGTKNCATLDPKEQARRISSPDRTAALSSVKSYFQDLVEDADLRNRCCRDDKRCANRLRTTRLQIEETENLNDWLAVTIPTRSNPLDPTTEVTIIMVSASRLLNGNNIETAKQLLNHEFGHACEEAWKYSNISGAHPRFSDAPFMREGCQTNAFNEFGVDEILGSTIAQCLRGRYKKYARSNGWRPCISVLLREGFADAVFANKNESVFHWGFSCEAKRDSSHPPIQDTLSCLIEDLKNRLAVCAH